MKRKKVGPIRQRIGLFSLAALLGWCWQGQNIREQIQIARYQPPTAIAQLATNTQMSDMGRKIFYLNNPQIEAQKDGLNLCKRDPAEEKTIILGCYVSNRGIFIQKVSDRRLAGVMEVTAAHEMLHSAYYRLAAHERQQVDRELQQVFQKLQNPRLKNLLEIYRQQDASAVSNELHSILGTEVAELTPFLEKYYQRYFKNRSTIVAFSQQYEQVFGTITAQSEALENQIQTMRMDLERLSAILDNEYINLKQQQSEIQGATDSSDYSSKINSYNQQLESYNQHVEYINQQQNTYRQLVANYNELYLEKQSLNNSLENSSN